MLDWGNGDVYNARQNSLDFFVFVSLKVEVLISVINADTKPEVIAFI